MDNPADITDVEDSFERPLTSDEIRVTPRWLQTAWRKLQRAVPGIPERTALDPAAEGYLATDDVIDVLVAMVERKLRNPGATRQWAGDDYSETIDSTLSTGQIYVTDQEIADLSPATPSGGSAIYSIGLSR
jgi:hypothetical protein